MAEQPSAITIAAIRMAEHILEARRRREAERSDRRRTMRIVKSEDPEAA